MYFPRAWHSTFLEEAPERETWPDSQVASSSNLAPNSLPHPGASRESGKVRKVSVPLPPGGFSCPEDRPGRTLPRCQRLPAISLDWHNYPLGDFQQQFDTSTGNLCLNTDLSLFLCFFLAILNTYLCLNLGLSINPRAIKKKKKKAHGQSHVIASPVSISFYH